MLPEDEWIVEEFSTNEENDSVLVVTPDGYKFRFIPKTTIVSFIYELNFNDQVFTASDGSRYRVMRDTVVVIDTDIWENPDFQYGYVICKNNMLQYVLSRYLLEKL